MTTITSSAGSWRGHASGWLHPLALILVFFALAGVMPSAMLLDRLLVVFAGVVALALLTNLAFAQVPPTSSHRRFGDLVVIALMAVSLTGVFWFRAASGISGWDGIGFGIIITLAWWLPAVAFAALYRHPGERWLAQGRQRFLGRIAVAALASLAGLPIHDVLKENRALQIERAGLPRAIDDLAARTLPDGADMQFQLDGGELHLRVMWPERQSPGSYRELAQLRALAGDAGRMRAGGADRLVERINVDQVRLEVRRAGRILASMDWPQVGLERGAEALVIDYDAAGLSRLPDQTDLDELLRSLPARHRTGNLCSQALDDAVWIGRCAESTSPSTIDEVRLMERDWAGANVLIRELGRVFPAIGAFRVELAGHTLEVPQSAVSPSFEARTLLPLPAETVRIWVSDDSAGVPPDAEQSSAPVEVFWKDGQWRGGANRLPLWPWQSGELSGAALRVYLLDVSPESEVRLLLEPLDPGASDAAAPITLSAGQTIEWEGVGLHHLGR